MGGGALSLCHKSMQHEGITPDSITYISLLQACASVCVLSFRRGSGYHVQIDEQGVEEDEKW